MNDMLKQIYKDKFFSSRPLTEEYQTLADKDCTLWEKARPLLGQELIDQIQDNQSDINYQTNYEWFREGFRLGASLMLELMD